MTRPWTHAALAVLVATAAAALPSEKEQWVSLRTPHLLVYSNTSAERSIELAERVETMRAAMGKLANAPDEDPVATTLFLFRSASSMTPYLPLDDAGKPIEFTGWCHAGWRGNDIVMDASSAELALPIVQHEYAHAFLASHFPPLPTWFDEGTAEIYGTFRQRGRVVEVGAPIDSRVAALVRDKAIPMIDVLEMTDSSPAYLERHGVGPFYAKSWALVHYFMFGSAERKAQLPAFLELLEKGTPIPEAAAKALSVTPEQLDAELSAYVRKNVWPYATFGMPEAPSAAGTARIVPHAEVVASLGDLLLATQPDRKDDAEAHFRAALALDPQSSVALGGMARLLEARGAHAEADAAFRQAVASPGADSRTSYQWGLALMRRARGGFGDRAALVTLAREQLRLATQLQPRLPDALSELADAAAADGTDLEEGLRAIVRARELLPRREDLVIDHAQLLMRVGKADEGRRLLVTAMASANPDIAQDARRVMQWGLAQEAEKLLQADKLPEALARYRRVVEMDPKSRVAVDVAEMIPELEKEIARRKEAAAKPQ